MKNGLTLSDYANMWADLPQDFKLLLARAVTGYKGKDNGK